MDDVTRVTLLLRLKDRTDQISWTEFDTRYHGLLYNYARARGASHDVAEEIVQEVELAIFKSIGNFEYDAGKGRFRGYLRRSVANALNRRFARESRQPRSFDTQEQDYALAEDDQMDEIWENEWRRHRIRRAMERISNSVDPGTIDAFVMHVLEEQSVESTCAALGITRDNLYQIKRRILSRLQEELKQEEEDL